MLNVHIDVLGIFHSLTITVKRMGPRDQIIRTFIDDQGFWNDSDRFIPWQAVLGVTVEPENA
jgi:hypothetical protein